jgi:hypothetical protein
MTTIYISIGNSDDKLTQFEWAQFYRSVDLAVSAAGKYVGVQIHGRWASLPHEPWQNACWCLAIDDGELESVVAGLRIDLLTLAKEFRQESIAWAAGAVEFLSPNPPVTA